MKNPDDFSLSGSDDLSPEGDAISGFLSSEDIFRIDSEVTEWSSVVERANSPEAREDIIRQLIYLMELEKLSITTSNPELKARCLSLINRTRGMFNLSPKYPEGT